jgi:hypothetical protein
MGITEVLFFFAGLNALLNNDIVFGIIMIVMSIFTLYFTIDSLRIAIQNLDN